jgi:hypothetical protein
MQNKNCIQIKLVFYDILYMIKYTSNFFLRLNDIVDFFTYLSFFWERKFHLIKFTRIFQRDAIHIQLNKAKICLHAASLSFQAARQSSAS